MMIFGRFSANISAPGYKFENRYDSHVSIYLNSIMLPHSQIHGSVRAVRGVASDFGTSSPFNKGPSVHNFHRTNMPRNKILPYVQSRP